MKLLIGERTGIRTPDTRLRRALLYPAELCTHIFKSGAGEGDRTLTAGLEGRNSTIELHPHILFWWRMVDSNHRKHR